jgi:hypothetical protein
MLIKLNNHNLYQTSKKRTFSKPINYEISKPTIIFIAS